MLCPRRGEPGEEEKGEEEKGTFYFLIARCGKVECPLFRLLFRLFRSLFRSSAEIRSFVEQYFHGNIILTTQPIDWRPPPGSSKFTLQPLSEPAIEKFLLSRQWSLLEHSTVRATQFEEGCREYLASALDSDQDAGILAATKRALSNPMDLTWVAQMISHGKHPDLFRLAEQQYDVMRQEFARTHLDTQFPLADFSEAVYQMRVADRGDIPGDDFVAELRCMESYKMVVLRQTLGACGETDAR